MSAARAVRFLFACLFSGASGALASHFGISAFEWAAVAALILIGARLFTTPKDPV